MGFDDSLLYVTMFGSEYVSVGSLMVARSSCERFEEHTQGEPAGGVFPWLDVFDSLTML